jgi:L-aspartate oxidase
MKAEAFDFVVIGSGLAGLSYALHAAEAGRVAILTKSEVHESNTNYAQGGIAAAVGEADSWLLHERDTLAAGAGLCDPEAVRFLVQKAPEAIEWLRQLGARFSFAGEKLALGKEGGHSRNRIVHYSDKTGWEIERAVVDAVRKNGNITVIERAFAGRLIMDGSRCAGVAATVEGLGRRDYVGRAVLLATGGCGRMYAHTTNPAVATADGIALAAEVGAEIRDMEFMQFHPTTLYHPQMRSFLITEAVRGAGGTLRNHLGERFMYDYHPSLELAPRDIVARAIEAEMKRLETWCVYLDVTHLPQRAIVTEFPTIYDRLSSIDLHIHKQWIPVVPAQHYSCGGVATDLNGCTSVSGLYAAGEVASTGVHGANRLASNSLLEAMVFGTSAAIDSLNAPVAKAHASSVDWPKSVAEHESVRLRHSLQRTMTNHVGVVRSTSGLETALRNVQALLRQYDGLPSAPYSPHPLETRNLLVAAEQVVQGALSRSDNVGLHYNEDRGTAR